MPRYDYVALVAGLRGPARAVRQPHAEPILLKGLQASVDGIEMTMTRTDHICVAATTTTTDACGRSDWAGRSCDCAASTTASTSSTTIEGCCFRRRARGACV